MPVNRGGLPLPRVKDTTLSAWITAVSSRIGDVGRLAQEADRIAKAAQSRADATHEIVNAPDDLRPYEPTGITPPLRGGAGIGIVMLFWPNPFVSYRNHGFTRVYRHTADEFNNAVQIGQSSGITYVDRQVVGDQTYYYWIVWVSQAGNTSDPSDSIELTPAIDPAVAIRELSAKIQSDPLTRDLLTNFSAASLQQLISERTNDLYAFLLDTIREAALDIETAARTALDARVALNELDIQALEVSLRATIAGKADASAVTDLTTRVTSTETDLASLSAELTALEALIGGRALGPEQNVFTGADRAAAEAARDTYQATNPNVTWNGVVNPWLDHYDADDDINIELRWGVLYVYQRRVGGAWVDNGEALARAAAVTLLQAMVTENADAIAANLSAITSLRASISRPLGPEQNVFTGTDRDAAEDAVDAYAAANPSWLGMYDANPGISIRLDWS